MSSYDDVHAEARHDWLDQRPVPRSEVPWHGGDGLDMADYCLARWDEERAREDEDD